MFKKFTERARKVIILAREEAEKKQHEYLGTEHLLAGILKDGGGVAIAVLQRLGADLRQIRQEVERHMPPTSTTLVIGDIPFTARAKKVLEFAVEEARSMGHSYIGTEHMLLGLIREKEGVAARILISLNLHYTEIREQTINLLREPVSPTQEKQQSKTPALDEFGRDLTELAKDGKLDPVIGRDNEIERVIQILARRTKNNPILIGEPGVGKTAIVEGLARRIFSREVPQLLYDKRVVALDLGAIIAGTKYRGQFEQRIKAIMKEIAQSRNVIIFIDEIHTLVGAGAAEGSVDASNMLKPALSRGEIQCVGATTIDEYRKYIEKNGALERRFQPIMVNAPSIDETIMIIKGLKNEYEAHHRAIITDGAISAAVTLSDRYISDRFLPDKAIDVIDEAGSRVRLRQVTFPPEVREMQKKIDDLSREKKERIEKQEFEYAVELRDQETRLRKDLEFLKDKLEGVGANAKPEVTESDVAQVVSSITGIPVYRLAKEDTEKLRDMAADINKRIFGQKEAVERVCESVRRSRAGLKDHFRPMGTFLFMGPTGVGKTELAHVLAENLFGDRRSLIRLDMSEYVEKFSASKLTGAPPGYVGYEEGGMLTELVRRKPYSVVLLDEIEKAHPDVYQMLLQIMDDGSLTDSFGRRVSFRNVILIMTSNLSARFIEKDFTMGFQTTENNSQDYQKMSGLIKAELKKSFSPEFINRIDEVVVFKKLDRESIAHIVDMQIEKVRELLKEEKLDLEITPEVKEWIINKGYDPAYGARPLRRVIQRYLENPLSEKILSGEAKSYGILKAEIRDDTIYISEKVAVEAV
ncbi:MAG: ATP-dependent Clp protease ATP-binding subunit [Nitrospinae bacterium]|nr:ATP-dependent Clp protease ATP-binding subunit [Nitrospinota bacterium]